MHIGDHHRPTSPLHALTRAFALSSRVTLADIVMRMLVFLLLIASQTGVAQQRSTAEAIEPAWVVELDTRERLVYPRVPRRLTRDVATRRLMFVDSVRPSPSGDQRTFFLREGVATSNPNNMQLATRGDGTPLYAHVTRAEQTSARHPAQATLAESWRALVGEGEHPIGVSLEEERAWEASATFRPPQLRVGAEWRDSLSWSAEYGGVRQRLRGVRVSTLVADSSLGTRWLVRDSALVTYAARFHPSALAGDSLDVVAQTLSGSTIGWRLVDRTIPLALWRSDSSSWVGTSTLREAGETAVTSPITYARTRQWRLRDHEAHELHERELSNEASRRRSGAMLSPSSAWSERILQGDNALRDSLEAVYLPTLGTAAHGAVAEALWWADARTPGAELRRRQQRIAAGDTALLILQLGLHEHSGRRRLDRDDVEFLLKLLDDRARLWEMGFPSARIRRLVVDELQRRPRVLHDTASWPCTPDACTMLEEQWPAARSRVAREIGLLTRFVSRPREMASAVRSEARRDSSRWQEALDLLDGVWHRGAPLRIRAIPRRGADWREWLHWLEGRDSPLPSGTFVVNELYWPRYEQAHDRALHLHAVAAGRDITAELREDFSRARSDSARRVLGVLMIHARRTPLPDSTIIAWLRSGDHVLVALAQREAIRAMHGYSWHASARDFAPVPAAVERELRTQLLVAMATGDAAWPHARKLSTRTLVDNLWGDPPLTPARDSILLLEDPERLEEIPPAQRARFRAVSRETLWRVPAGIPFSAERVEPIVASGPFVIVSRSTWGQIRRADGASRHQFGAYSRFALLRVGNGWYIVASENSIT